jgi:hypothetical protein
MTVTMVVAMVAAMVAAITGGENEGVIIKNRQQNEEVTFGNNPFSLGKCLSYHDDGSGRYQYWNFSATAHRICRTTGGDRDTGYVCLRCP